MTRSSSAPTRLARIARRGSLALVAGAGAAALLAGCGTSQLAETSKIKPAVQGANADSRTGTIALRDLAVLYQGDADQTYPAGSNAPLVVRIANSGSAGDYLTSVTTSAADSVVYLDDTATPSATPSASASGSASPSASASPQQPGKKHFRIHVPAMGLVQLLPENGQYLELVNLSAPLYPGQSVSLVFHFAKAGDVAIKVPLTGPTAVASRSSAPGVESGE